MVVQLVQTEKTSLKMVNITQIMHKGFSNLENNAVSPNYFCRDSALSCFLKAA